jgi:NodT family efflux transporter outer membrane factor (OMF) lipoprotein
MYMNTELNLPAWREPGTFRSSKGAVMNTCLIGQSFRRERAAVAAARRAWRIAMHQRNLRLPQLPRAGAIAAAAVSALALAACATPVAKQAVAVPTHFAATASPEDQLATTSGTEPEAAWWERYGDPVLSDLIRRAAYENRDVKIAAERVRAARAGQTISRSWLLPSLDLVGGAVDQRTGYGAPITDRIPNVKTAGGGADVSWEVDLSGRLRAGAAAAAAETRAAQHGLSGVRLLVLTDVASNYFMLVGAERQLDNMRAIATAQDETLRLVSARQRVGLATDFDVERAQAAASNARAAIPPLETLIAVSRHRIAVLIGDQAFNAGAISPWNGDITVPASQPGQPAALLQRRPDLLVAQAQLDAANARRQQAKAEWFPRLFMSAVFGRSTADANTMALGPARFSNAAALLAMPIFNAGRTMAVNDIAKSEQSVAVLHYEDAIVRALEDVENALTALHDERDRARLLQSAAQSADAAYGRAQSLYSRGQIDLLPLLDAERTRLAVRVSANDSNTQLLLDSVQLYKALGGGWQVFEPKPASAAAPAKPSPNS